VGFRRPSTRFAGSVRAQIEVMLFRFESRDMKSVWQVELNPRHGRQTQLKDGDRLEIVHFVVVG
jgi:hypothetical protein